MYYLLQDSLLVNGVAFKKTFSYAGFEMQPKAYSGTKIAMLNVELELKAERDNALIRVENVEVGVPSLVEFLVHFFYGPFFFYISLFYIHIYFLNSAYS